MNIIEEKKYHTGGEKIRKIEKWQLILSIISIFVGLIALLVGAL